MKATRDVVKTLIELSPTAEEADKVIEENYGFKSIAEKLAFIKGMFDVEVISIHVSDASKKEQSDQMIYWSMLNAIVVEREC